jgi:hypothetical protein
LERVNPGNFKRAAIAGLLIAQLALGQTPAGGSVKESIAALRPKAKVELRLADGSDLRGRILSHAEADFVLKQDGGAGQKTLAYDRVRSVSALKANHSKTKWIVIGWWRRWPWLASLSESNYGVDLSDAGRRPVSDDRTGSMKGQSGVVN